MQNLTLSFNSLHSAETAPMVDTIEVLKSALPRKYIDAMLTLALIIITLNIVMILFHYKIRKWFQASNYDGVAFYDYAYAATAAFGIFIAALCWMIR